MPSHLRLVSPLFPLLFVAAAVQAQEAPASPAVVNSGLDSALFYQLLLGELDARGGDPGAGYSLLLDAARKTGDARLYQRAVEIALQGRAGESALQAARAWRQALPNSEQANRQYLLILVALNRLSDAVEPLRREIALAPKEKRAEVIAQLPRYFARVSNKKLAASVLEQALAEYLPRAATGAAAWTAVGRLRLEASDPEAALDAARRGQAVDAKAEAPALLAMVLMDPARPRAEAMVRKYLDASAARSEVRMEYARRLLEAQRYAEAGEQIRQITRERPELAEAWLLQGLIELQEQHLDAAQTALQQFLQLFAARPSTAGTGEQDRALVQAYLSLSQIAQQRGDMAGAEQWLAKITSTQDLVRVQGRRAALLAQQGRVDEARQLIRALPERGADDARMKLNAEVQLLREVKQYRQAYQLLEDARRSDPDNPELLYDQATLAEKLGDFDGMEQLLRQVMAVKPDYHHAYNALGYSLAERGIRLDEARALVLKALEFAPGDPFITDSLAWVEFRQGHLEQARQLLEMAYHARPDAEIAAHLGEVLWAQGHKAQALTIWREGAALNPDNETLRATLQRLGAQL